MGKTKRKKDRRLTGRFLHGSYRRSVISPPVTASELIFRGPGGLCLSCFFLLVQVTQARSRNWKRKSFVTAGKTWPVIPNKVQEIQRQRDRNLGPTGITWFSLCCF